MHPQSVDAGQLPHFLGGDCQCPNGCVPLPKPADESDVARRRILVVTAGKCVQERRHLHAEDEATWRWALEARDINYSVSFTPLRHTNIGEQVGSAFFCHDFSNFYFASVCASL